jgi:hypothetical protein
MPTPRNLLVVAELDGQVVGTLQLTFIPSLSRVGGERAQIDALRLYRSLGFQATHEGLKLRLDDP